MLGDKKGEFTGTTANKILPAENGSPIIETTTAGSGSLLGVEGMFHGDIFISSKCRWNGVR